MAPDDPRSVSPSARNAAMKVCVPHFEKGALAFSRRPRITRPRSRAMRVDTAVSSMNTRCCRRWHSQGRIQRNQRWRRLATSARSISCAAKAFFISPSGLAQQPRQRVRAHAHVKGLLQAIGQFRHGDVGRRLEPANQRRLDGASLPQPGRRPRHPGAANPVACAPPEACRQLALTPNRLAAARRDDPPWTATITPSHESIEIIFAMATPPATVNQITPASGKTIPYFKDDALSGIAGPLSTLWALTEIRPGAAGGRGRCLQGSPSGAHREERAD